MKKIFFVLGFVFFIFTLQLNIPRSFSAEIGDKCENNSDCSAVPTPTNKAKIICKQNSCLVEPAPGPCAKGKFVKGKCTEFKTGLGNISADASGFISSIFAVLLAAAGGIALLLIMRAGYKIMMSQGNQEAIKEGREQLISAIVGLLFLIFSLVLLQLIGVDILRIPGLKP